MEKEGVNRPAEEKAPPDIRQDRARLRKETLAKIGKLQRKFTGELLSAALFLLLSIAALYDFAFFPSLPENIRATLGKPPSVTMIGAVLLIYVFSGIILILSRMTSGSGKYGGVSHVGFIAGFYFFYHFSGNASGELLGGVCGGGDDLWAGRLPPVDILFGGDRQGTGSDGVTARNRKGRKMESDASAPRVCLLFVGNGPIDNGFYSPDWVCAPLNRELHYLANISTLALAFSSLSQASLVMPFSCVPLAMSLVIKASFSIRFSKLARLMP